MKASTYHSLYFLACSLFCKQAKAPQMYFLCVVLPILMLMNSSANAQQAAQIPEIPAFLPMAHTIPAGSPSAIDGTWRISSLGKRIRIEGGRAYALDSWLHLFVLKIQPNMVVIKNIRRVGRNKYSGEDLPLMGKWQAIKDTSGALTVSVAGVLGPVQYRLEPVGHDRIEDEYDTYPEEDYPEDDYPDEDNWDEGNDWQDESEEEWEEEWQEPPAESPRPQPVQRDTITPNCGGPGQQPCTSVKAKFRGKAQKLGCPGKQNYFSTLHGGSCWTCPSNYKRTHRPLNHAKACKKRKSISGPWKPAKRKGRAWGCGHNQFHVGLPTGGSCYSCPKGFKRVHTLGADTLICKPENRCDGNLRVAKQPPQKDFLRSIVGSSKVKVCAPKFDLKLAAKRELPKFNHVKKGGLNFLKDVMNSGKRYRNLKRAIKKEDWDRVHKIVMSFSSMAQIVKTAKASGFSTLSVGVGSDIQIGIGGNSETGIAMNLRSGKIQGYQSSGFSKGLSIGVDSGINLGLWKGKFESGYTQGFTTSVGGVISAGAGVWYTYYDTKYPNSNRGQERLAGLTFSAGVGAGAEIGEYNEVGTKLLN